MSGLLGWLPQLDPIALRVHDPGEAAVIVVLAFGVDFDSFFAERGEQRVQVVHQLVDHEPRPARIEIFRVFFEERPDCHAGAFRIFRIAPMEHHALTVWLPLQSKMLFVPAV
jgi:hypothetical protein